MSVDTLQLFLTILTILVVYYYLLKYLVNNNSGELFQNSLPNFSRDDSNLFIPGCIATHNGKSILQFGSQKPLTIFQRNLIMATFKFIETVSFYLGTF